MTGPGVLSDRSWMTTDKAGIERGPDGQSEAEEHNQKAKRAAHEIILLLHVRVSR